MHRCRLIYSIVYATLIVPAGVLYAQPANDNICSAIPLTVGATNCSQGSNVAATTSGGDPIGSCWVGGTKSHTVWYSFIAPSFGNVAVTLDHPGGTLTDSQIGIYSSSDNTCSGTLSEVGCDDDGGTDCVTCASASVTGLVAGNTYFVEVDGYSTLTGTFCIDVHDGGAVLTNDGCSNAMNLWVGALCSYQLECTYTNYPSPTTYATGEGWETAPACWTQGTGLNTVWFRFTAVDVSTTLTIEIGGSGNNPHAAVYSGSCGSLTLVACQEDRGDGGSEKNGVNLTFTTTVGQVYYIQYDSDAAGSCNNICLTSPANGLTTPGNDACAGAIAMTEGAVYTGNNWLGTSDGDFSCGMPENTIWYSFTPSATLDHVISLTNLSDCSSENNTASTHTGFYAANLQLVMYNTGTCTPTSNEKTCVSVPSTSDITETVALTAGTTYLIMIDGYGGAGCGFSLKIEEIDALPVELLSFTGKQTDNGVALEWVTASEINNDYFAVERSQNGQKFREVGRIRGVGNAQVTHSYRFTDNTPLYGDVYYRLAQVDHDGIIHYIPHLVYVSTDMAHPIIYPNPLEGDQFHIALSHDHADELLVHITDAAGRSVMPQATVHRTGNLLFVRMDKQLQPGVYIVRMISQYTVYPGQMIVKK